MSESEIEEYNQKKESRLPDGSDQTTVRRRSYFTRRNALIVSGSIAVIAVVLALISVISYRYGVLDNYVKDQFVAKMHEIGVDFDADVFRLTVSPLALELKNATFNNRVTGEKLFFIRDAQLELSIQDLFSWQLSRDISIDSTEINGLEAWVTFDENGGSNFSELTFVEDEAGSRVNFKYQSMRFTLRDGVIHFGDLSRKLSGDANNVNFSLEPLDPTVPDEDKRYTAELSSTGSRFVYDDRPLEEIDIRARGIVDKTGAEISELTIQTPIGTSSLNGTLTDWATLRYDLNIESTVDLTQTSNLYPLGATLRGVGNFRGRVTGEGENYKIDGKIDADALSADGIYLKAVNVAATVEGTNTNYIASGTAAAELLTFDDFRIEFPRIAGNVRGTGTDFRWFGELQAAAVRSGSLTLGGLFLSDASAELRDRELIATAVNGRARRFSVAEFEFANLITRDLRLTRSGDITTVTAPGLRADSFSSEDFTIRSVEGSNVRIRDVAGQTSVDADALRANEAVVGTTRLRNVRADSFSLNNLPSSTGLTARNLKADRLDADGVNVGGLQADEVTVRNTSSETVIHSDMTRIASLNAGGAVLGSLNIAGVRMTVRAGRVEARSNDIDAGQVKLAASNTLSEGGTLEGVRIERPVFILEPSGRYRASADMSLGGGIIGSIPLGAAQAEVTVDNDRLELTGLVAQVMDGEVNGTASVAFSSSNNSSINAQFDRLDLSKLLAMQAGRVIPLEGQSSGTVNLTFDGTDFQTTSGTVNADITADAGEEGTERIPISGRVELTADRGLVNIDVARLNTPNSEVNADGQFDLRGTDSALGLRLRSTDATEIDRLIRVLNISPELTEQLDSLRVSVAGDLAFDGDLTGNISDPTLIGQASLQSVALQGRELGSVRSNINVSPLGIDLTEGRLDDGRGGTADFTVRMPSGGANNTSVRAELTNVNAGNLLAALPFELPENFRDFTGSTSGIVDLSGLPNESQGKINISSSNGTIGGQAFDELRVNAIFNGNLIELQDTQLRLGEGLLTASGTYDRVTTEFDLGVDGKEIPLSLVTALLPANQSLPRISGTTSIKARASGQGDQTPSYNVEFSGSASNVVVNDNTFGNVSFRGDTAGQILTAQLTAILEGRPQEFNASVNFGNEDLPFRVEHTLDQSPLRPLFALIPQLQGISLGGAATGRVELGGNLSSIGEDGIRRFTTEELAGRAQFSELSLLIENTPLVAIEPVTIAFSPRTITFESARFAGGGSNLVITGTKALTDDGMNNLSLDGRVNLGLLNVIPGVAGSDIFFGGYADIAMRLAGVNRTANLSGTANLENGSLSTFVGSSRLSFDRLSGRILFTSNQAQIEQLTGYLGGGRFVASGGALFGNGLQVNSYRVALTGTNITVPLPEDFLTTGDARLEISGRRVDQNLTTLIAGSILARRSLYTQDIDLATLVGGRSNGSLSGGASTGLAPRFDLVITGRDALVIRNNIADLTASADLRLTGTTANPQISGRITANSGTVFFRKDRYDVQRGVLEFPPNTDIEPVIFLQAETEIQGYQIFVNLSGPLTDTELLNASVRSSPALPQPDVISLITTGSLSNTDSGIPTLASTGINTAAEVLTDSIINNPARRATDRLFGLNVFEIDPIISGERINPTARLTVGRQINNNLRVTYSTNLSQDQNQVLALEYRVSNKLSFVAQYEQSSLSNVTANRDNFSFEVRFRRRF